MKTLPTGLLRTFTTVVDVGGFSQAAELLGRSQPAVSLQVKKLEALIGSQLLVRHASKPTLTQNGAVLESYARKILALNDEAINHFEAPAVSGKIHFGIPSEFATTLLPKIIGRFASAYPGISLEVTCALSKELLSAPQSNTYDLVLALHDQPESAGGNLVNTDELVWVGRPGIPGSELPPDTAIPLIVAPEGCIYRKRGIQQLNASARSWKIAYTNPDLTGIQTAIEEGLGITVLAKKTVPEQLRVIKRPNLLPELGKVGISLQCKQRQPSEAALRLMEFVTSSLG